MTKLLCALLFLLIACTPAPEPSAPLPESDTPVPEQTSIPEKIATKQVAKSEIPEPEVRVETSEVIPNECETFGCPVAEVVADIQMDLYYECHCARARWIKPENLLCFVTEADAIERGYRKAKSC